LVSRKKTNKKKSQESLRGHKPAGKKKKKKLHPKD